MVGDTFVAVDTGLAVIFRRQMLLPAGGVLQIRLHRGKTVTITAFARVATLQGIPHLPRQVQVPGLEFFACVDRTDKLMEQLVSGADFAYYFMRPILGNMAVRAGCPHAAAVSIVDRLAVFLKHVIPHLMATNAEALGIGRFQCGVEAAPGKHACQKAECEGKQRI